MAVETEKKYLLTRFPSALPAHTCHIYQGYIINKKTISVRIRISGDDAFLTIKGPTCNASRKEFEYPVPQSDALEMLSLFCKPPFIEKTRYHFEYKGFEWIVDKFSGENHGLMVAEIELTDIDQTFEKPSWVGKEVTHDARYYNSNLILAPYSTWKNDQ